MKYATAERAIEHLLELRLTWFLGYAPMTWQEQYLATFVCQSTGESVGTAIVVDQLLAFSRMFEKLRRSRSREQLIVWVGVRFYKKTANDVAKRLGVPSRTAYAWVHAVDAAFENLLDERDMLDRVPIRRDEDDD